MYNMWQRIPKTKFRKTQPWKQLFFCFLFKNTMRSLYVSILVRTIPRCIQLLHDVSSINIKLQMHVYMVKHLPPYLHRVWHYHTFSSEGPNPCKVLFCKLKNATADSLIHQRQPYFKKWWYFSTCMFYHLDTDRQAIIKFIYCYKYNQYL